MVKNLPAMQETQVQSLGQEDPMEKEMATHSSILAWKILWTEEPGGLWLMGSQRVGVTEQLSIAGISVLKKDNKAERGREEEDPALGEEITRTEPPTQRGESSPG